MPINYRKQGLSNKRRGRVFEQKISKALQKIDTSCRRTPMSGAWQLDFAGDIFCRNHEVLSNSYIECKYRKNQSLPSWIQEAKDRIQNQSFLIIIYAKPYGEEKVYYEELRTGKIHHFSWQEFVKYIT